MRASFLQPLRSAFLAGLLITVPIGVTFFVLWFAVSQVDALQPTEEPIPGLGILLVTVGILFVGLLTQNWLGARFIRWYEAALVRVPVLSSLYNGVKQVVEAALSQGSTSVKGVVLVQWPRAGLWSLGFHTGDAPVVGESGERFLNIFLPSTPNPTTGFYFVCQEDEVVRTSLTVEDAAKLLMSAGIVGAENKIVVPTSRGPIPLALPSHEDASPPAVPA